MSLSYLRFQITFGKFDCRICGKVYQSKGGLANHHRKKHVEKSGTANKDYFTGKIVANSKLLELLIKAAEKIQKQDYYPANLKDEIHVFSTTVTEKTLLIYTLTCPRSK